MLTDAGKLAALRQYFLPSQFNVRILCLYVNSVSWGPHTLASDLVEASWPGYLRPAGTRHLPFINAADQGEVDIDGLVVHNTSSSPQFPVGFFWLFDPLLVGAVIGAPFPALLQVPAGGSLTLTLQFLLDLIP